METNSLYYGDCLDWMQEWPSESVDLIYLDPPFNSSADYNILFGQGNGTPAQVRGFTDTWRWDEAAADRVSRFESAVAHPLHDATVALKRLLGPSGMLAYLTYMGERLVETRRLLKPTGSIYLHCDDTASHYLKALMDAIFGTKQFRNEIVWMRSMPHGNVSRSYGRIHDTILFYVREERGATWTSPAVPYTDPDERTRRQYRNWDPEREDWWQPTSLLNPNPDRPNLTYQFHGHTRVWRWTKERMEREDAAGRIYVPPGGGVPRYKRYLSEQRGRLVQDIWNDIPPIPRHERLGYPTQKPLALLERILSASSKPEDIVLDPFCGCGTTVVAAHNLERRWIGIDISATAIDIIQDERLKPLGIAAETFGIPQDLASARKLASDRPFDFEAWAVTRIPGMAPNERKRGDRGIDGRGSMLEAPKEMETRLVLAQVKGGRSFQIGAFRDFLHVIEREDAALGVYITLEGITSGQARAEARAMGTLSVGASTYQRVQLWSIENFFDGRSPSLPTLTDPNTGRPIQATLL